MLKAVIFDLDGILVNTEPLYDQHKVSYIKKKFDIDYDEKYNEKTRGLSARSFWEMLFTDFNITHSLDDIVKESRKVYFEFLKQQKLKPVDGTIKLIEKLEAENIHMGVASSASLRRITLILKSLRIFDKFKVIICSDDVGKGKPDPDIYLKAADKLGFDPKDCIAIEDATNGVKSAKAAGMKVVGFKGFSRNTQDLSKADLIIKSFSKLSISKLKSLASKT